MKTGKIKKLRGSVLLTVVSVMALLIIFLFGTLILATAANNRAHVNYSTTQTGVTARMVVDTAFKAIQEDNTYASAITSLDASSGTLNIPVAISSNSTSVSTFGHIDGLTAVYAGKKKYYNSTQKEWQDCDVVKLTATVTMNGVTSSSIAYVVKDPPSPGAGGGGGAGFVTTGDANISCQTNLYGGSYIGLPTLSDAQTYHYPYDDPLWGDYLTHNKTSIVNSGATIEADTVINGDMYVENMSGFFFPGQGKGVTVWGDCEFHNNSYDHLKTDSNLRSSSLAYIDFNQIPYFYIDGKLKGTKVKLGAQTSDNNSNFPLNLFAGSIDLNSGGAFSVSGDIYLMNPYESSKIVVNDSALYNWTASVVTHTSSSTSPSTAGRLYSKGSVELGAQNNQFTVNGLYCEKDVTITGKVKVNGDLVVGGMLKVNGNLEVTGNVYCGSASGNNVTAGSKTLKAGVSTDTVTYVPIMNYKIKHNGWVEDQSTGFAYVDPTELSVTGYPVTTVDLVDWSGNNLGTQDFYNIGGAVLFDETIGQTADVQKKTNQIQAFDTNAPTSETLYIDSNGNGAFDAGEGIPEAQAYDYADIKVNGVTAYTPADWVSSHTYIYPNYAERDVILGLDTITDATGAPVPTDKSQIVMRMEQVLSQIVNPYDSAELPTAVRPQYAQMIANRNGYICKSIADIEAKSSNKVCTSWYNSSTNKVAFTYGTYGTDTGWPVVNTSCILGDLSTNSELGFAAGDIPEINGRKAVVFNPGSSALVVVIDKASLASGVDLIVDESQGGQVYFYISQNGKLDFSGGLVITSKWLQLLLDNQDFQAFTDATYVHKNASGAEDPTSYLTLGLQAPNLFVYGGSNSVLNFSNFQTMSANVVSPNVSVTVAATSTNILSDNTVYYNGEKVDSQYNFIIGCCNSKETTFPNQVNMIYIPQGSNTPPTVVSSTSHWYELIYYDEY